jgi:hypothetical protein
MLLFPTYFVASSPVLCAHSLAGSGGAGLLAMASGLPLLRLILYVSDEVQQRLA